jgi:tetratricopeptide (TPR) repeat protein
MMRMKGRGLSRLAALGPLALGVLLALGVWLPPPSMAATASVANNDTCGGLNNAYGPWDYSDADQREKRLPIVEQFHFNSDVETLKSGLSGDLALDLDYTLRAFPNHPRALWAMARLQLRDGYPAGAKYYSADCYFERALRWRPADPAVWLVYGMYLQRKKDFDGAIEKYRHALQLQPENLEAHYSLGLVYAEKGEYEQAREQAKIADKGGYPLPGLRHILEKKGQWK